MSLLCLQLIPLPLSGPNDQLVLINTVSVTQQCIYLNIMLIFISISISHIAANPLNVLKSSRVHLIAGKCSFTAGDVLASFKRHIASI